MKEQLKKIKPKDLDNHKNLLGSGHLSSEDHKDDLESPDHVVSDDDAVGSPDKDQDGDATKKDKKNLLNNAAAGYQTLYKTTVTESKSAQKGTKFRQFNFEKRQYTKYSCPLSHFDGYNLWLLKPTHLNRGRGIHVFNDLNTLHKLIKEYCLGKEEESWKKKNKQFQKDAGGIEDAEQNDQNDEEQEQNSPGDEMMATQSPEKKSAKKSSFKIKHNDFIIQKYIERPLLIFNRKFDIRVWVLLDQEQNLFMFREGYIRTSGSEFGIDIQNVDNAAVHLTNNAVQKQLDSYGKFEDGNQLSFKRF